MFIDKYTNGSPSIGCKEKDCGQIGSMNGNVKWDSIFVSFPNVYLLVCKYRYRSSSIGCKEKDSGQIGSINENVKWDDIFVIFPNVYHH